ncbi:MAG TPA: ATP-binding cassette domain-containing protein [Chitinophagaceae bacterium]
MSYQEQHTREAVITIRGLSKSFGSNHVLRGIDFDLYPGENAVVLGRSGTGKSVLIRMIVGLLRPDEGTVKVFGEDVERLDKKQLAALRLKIGFLFQHNALYDSMTIGENLEFPLRRNEKALAEADVHERVTSALDAVGLSKTIDQYPSELSGGQQKRISIARTLIMKPEIMLYDEPTSGLDPLTSGEINQLINDVKDRYKTSSIIITHDLTCAKMTGDRVFMLLDGQFVKSGDFEQVFNEQDKRIQGFYKYNFIQ